MVFPLYKHIFYFAGRCITDVQEQCNTKYL